MIAQAMAISDTDDAVSALKVAGQFGVSQVGPAVDRQTHNRSKALTTAASHDNGMLQAITTSMAGWMWATTILFPGLSCCRSQRRWQRLQLRLRAATTR